MQSRFRLLMISFVTFGLLVTARAQQSFGSWPEGKDPKVVGKRLAENLVNREGYMITRSPGGGMSYPEVCTAYGALRFAGTTQDKELLDKLVKRYEVIVTNDGKLPDGRLLTNNREHVDWNVFGIVPLEIYKQTNDKRWLDAGKPYADRQWVDPREDGLTRHTRFWIDDMFMITAIQTQAYRTTKDPVYLDRAALEMVAYLDKLQQPNGLFFHGEGAEYFWGRGDGWVAAGMAELLSELPEDHKHHARIMDGYKKMMAALLKYQGASGMWHQLIDDPQSWPESSCTGMFTFAMATGVKKGWLDAAEYKEPVSKAWLALCDYIDEDANVREVCVGTNKSPDRQFYLDRPRRTGDLHGQAGAIWAAWAVLD